MYAGNILMTSHIRPSTLHLLAKVVILSACLMGQAKADSFEINKGWRFVGDSDSWSEQVDSSVHARYREVVRTGNFILIEDDTRKVKL